MNEDVRNILTHITELEDELREALQSQQHELRYRLEGTRVRFEQSIREAHRELRVGLLRYLAGSRLRNMVTAPIIYALVVPLALLDACVSIYQIICFPLYRVPRVRRRTHVVIDRHHLRYLNSLEKLNCVYCGYAAGVLSYAREIAARTELYWCPIKHARQILDRHRRYVEYADFGDAESYRETVARLRGKLADERIAAAGKAAQPR